MAKLVLHALLCLAFLLQNLNAAPRDDAGALIAEIENTILESGANFLSQYEQLKKQALDAGIDITECIDAFEDRFINLGSDNVQRFESCVSDSSAEYLEAISTCGEMFTANTNGVGEGMLAGLQICIEYQQGSS